MGSEEVKRAMKSIAKRRVGRSRLVYSKDTKEIEPVDDYAMTDRDEKARKHRGQGYKCQVPEECPLCSYYAGLAAGHADAVERCVGRMEEVAQQYEKMADGLGVTTIMADMARGKADLLRRLAAEMGKK